MTILKYTDTRNLKTRSLPPESLGGRNEAVFYDLIFNALPLRVAAHECDLSYQGVYIRALAYMQLWNRLGLITFNPEKLKELTKEYSS